MIILKTLGAVSIEIEDVVSAYRRQLAKPTQSCTTPRAWRRFALLLYLAAEHGRSASRDQLTTLIFPDKAPPADAHSLRELIYQLRRAGVPIVSTGRQYIIESRFVRADYDEALSAPTLDDETLNAMLGGFLPTVTAPWSEAYTEWLDAWRAARIGELTRRTVVQIEQATHAGSWEAVERAARACLGVDPWNETATFSLAEGLAVGGSKAAAFQLLDRYIAEVAPQSADLAGRATRRRRRMSDGPSTTVLRGTGSGAIDDNGAASPRLIGRAGELGTLIATFDRAEAGESQCFVVAGEAGIGKTRLVADFSAAAQLRQAHVERVTIQPHDGDRPMGAFVDLVPGLLEANGALGCSEASMAALRNLIGQRGADDASPQTAGSDEHEQRWSAVSRAVVDLCDAIASEQTLVLVIEDAHWLDALSANTIGRIVGTKRKARILVVATTRDPRPLVREIRLTERCQTISLGQLTPVAAAELLDIVLPIQDRRVREDWIGESLQSLKDRIASISAGNPLFLISLAAHSRAHRGPFEVPGTIVETFAQRIDALSHRAMTLLATCAQLGKHSTIKRLVLAMEMKKHALVEALLELTDSGLVLRDAQAANLTHPLVSEALRTRLHELARRAVADAVAGTLEKEAEGGQSPALWWDVAESWRVADNPEKAIHALKRCAQHALEIGRPGEAARILYEAAALPQPVEYLLEMSEILIRAADEAAEYPLVLRGFQLRRQAHPAPRHDEIEELEWRALLALDHSERPFAQRLHQCLLAQEASPRHRTAAAIMLLKCADMFGRRDLGLFATKHVSANDLAMVDPLVALEFELLKASVRGRRAAAAAVGRKILEKSARSLEPAPLHLQRNAATAIRLAGDATGAIEAFEELYRKADRGRSPKAQLYSCLQLSSTYRDLGVDTDADVWLSRAMSIAADSDHLTTDFELVAARIETAIGHGHFERAEIAMREGDAAATFSGAICRRFRRAAELAIQVAAGHRGQSTRELVRAIADDDLRSMTGIREFEIAVLVDALGRLGLADDAKATLAAYLAARDELRPLSALLTRSAHVAGCEALTERFNRSSAARWRQSKKRKRAPEEAIELQA